MLDLSQVDSVENLRLHGYATGRLSFSLRDCCEAENRI